MELDDVERLVRQTLALTGDFAASKRVDDAYLSLTITPLVADGDVAAIGRTRARIWTTGVEAFFLELDERYSLKEFDWEPAGQADIVRLMTRLACAYLLGRGTEVETKAAFGRLRRHFEIELDGQTYRFANNG